MILSIESEGGGWAGVQPFDSELKQMTKVANVLDAAARNKQRKIFSTDDQCRKLNLNPSPEAMEKIQKLELSFALADRNMGMLRVG